MKTLVTFLMCFVIVTSCTSTKSANANNKPDKRVLKGTWEVTEIRFVGEEGLYKAELFDLADSPCFKGSEWVFIPNNGTGKFTLKQANGCEPSSHRILWSFFESGDGTHDLQFKFVDNRNKPLSGNMAGYSLKLSNLSASTMETRVKTNYQGTPFDVVLSLEKISDEITL